MKTKKRILYAMYLTVLFLTLCVFAFSIIWALIAPQAPGASGLSLDRGFDVFVICILSIPLLIAEFEIFYCAKYFFTAETDKKNSKAFINVILCVLSVVIPLFTMMSLFSGGVVAEVFGVLLWTWMLLQPIFRIVCLLKWCAVRHNKKWHVRNFIK